MGWLELAIAALGAVGALGAVVAYLGSFQERKAGATTAAYERQKEETRRARQKARIDEDVDALDRGALGDELRSTDPRK